jgi:uncharacterized protein YdiU (UPF0061 family)
MPLIGDDVDAVQAALEPYKTEFADAMTQALRDKLGLATAQADDSALADDLLRLLAADRVDYTIAMRTLAQFSTEPSANNSAVRDHFVNRDAFDAWAARYRTRLQAETSTDAQRAARMNRVNPKYVLRNHLAETAIQQAQAGDMGEVHRLLKVLQRPFDEQAGAEHDAALPPDWARQLEVSCSS